MAGGASGVKGKKELKQAPRRVLRFDSLDDLSRELQKRHKE